MENQDTNQQKENKSVGEEIGGVIGKEIGAEIGKEVEKRVTGEGEKEKSKKGKKKKSPAARRVTYILGLFFALLFLWIINNIDNWGWEFITDDWEQVVGVVKFSIYLSIVIYGLFLFYDKKLFYLAGKVAMDAVSIYVSVRLYQVFPFKFDNLFDGWEWLGIIFPWVLIIAIIGTAISIVVRTGKFLAGKNIYE